MHAAEVDFTPDFSGLSVPDWRHQFRALGTEHGFHEPLGRYHAASFVDAGDTLVVSFDTLPRLSRIDDLAVFGAHLPKALTAIAPGRQELVRAVRDEHVLELKVSATEIRMVGDAGGDVQTLLAIENIRSELDDREINAWRDLIRVLTHEIMNSITPVTSLAKTAADLVDDAR